VSGQDESNPALWLATRAGKMELSCRFGTTRRVPQKKFPRKPYNKSFIGQACSVKMAGYWPRSFFASLWTSTPSRSINTKEKNLANILPSCPHTWSITHTSWPHTWSITHTSGPSSVYNRNTIKSLCATLRSSETYPTQQISGFRLTKNKPVQLTDKNYINFYLKVRWPSF